MSRLVWDARPRNFTGLSSAVLGLDAAHWEAAGAKFADDGDPEFPRRIATASVATEFAEQQSFAVVDEGDVTTLLVSAEPRWLSLAGAALLLSLNVKGLLDVRNDVLQSDIGAPRPPELQAVGGLVALQTGELERLIQEARGRYESPVSSAAVPAISELEAADRKTGVPSSALRRVSDFVAILGGGEPSVLRLLPTERLAFVTRGYAVALSAFISGLLLAFAIHSWLTGSVPLSILVALTFGAMSAALLRPGLVFGYSSSNSALIISAVPRLALFAIVAYVDSQAVLLRVFRPEILARTHGHGSHVGLAGSIAALDRLASVQGGVRVAQVLIPMMVFLITVAPMILAVFSRSRLYARMVENIEIQAASALEERLALEARELNLDSHRRQPAVSPDRPVLHEAEDPDPGLHGQRRQTQDPPLGDGT
jgi:hypothetical protein